MTFPPMTMKIPALLALLSASLLCADSSCNPDSFTVTVSHDLDIARPGEVIVMPWTEVISRLPGALPDHVAVRDASGAVIPAQTTNFMPEMRQGHVDDLIFQHDFAAGEKQAVFTIEMTEKPVPPFPRVTFARYVPERFDDFAWENDRIAHRIYGPALDTEAAGKSRLRTSGIDVWAKRVRYPIVDRWYQKGHDNYHKDTGEGLDLYSVGASCGCGGLGIWDGTAIHTTGNWVTWKVLANGPIRSVFELTFPPVTVGDTTVTETKRFTVDAGRNLDQIDSTFSFESAAGEITVAIGIAKHEKEAPGATITRSREGAWMGLWENYIKTAGLGTGVILDRGAFKDFTEDDANYLILATARPGVPLRHYAGAGWERSGDFASKADWDAYLDVFAKRLASPVRISFNDAAK